MMHEPPRAATPTLIRAIGRWSMVALAVNCIIGSGIFGLPSVVAGFVGRQSPQAVLVAGVAMGVIVACYAEVASQFTETGGHYLYVRQAFGRFAGLQVGWMNLLSRLTACAAAVNLLVISLGEFWAQAGAPLPRLAVVSLFVGTLAMANYRGVSAGSLVSNVSVIAKLVPLAVVCAVGLAYLAIHPYAAPAGAGAGVGVDDWLKATLILFFSYGGYEAALNPLGEAKDPRRDAPFALFMALGVVTLFYTALQFVVVGVLPDAAHSVRPLADVAQVTMGRAGAVLISLGALVSVYGYLSAHLLTNPRAMFALAERGDFPPWFAAIHARFRTPYFSIVVFAALVWGFALFGNFAWNVTLSAVARLFYYGAVCAAVPALRRKQPGAVRLRLPGGPVLPVLGVLICTALLTRVDFSKSLILLATIAAATSNWLVVRRRNALPLPAR
ncbi:MAG TPA: APC family permease [Steroidobacteraceae bacterium]|jgi:APA family basic amino acid/polyamine antiporter|nr:APC family permease [Steroidobacteraceae bacterium]